MKMQNVKGIRLIRFLGQKIIFDFSEDVVAMLIMLYSDDFKIYKYGGYINIKHYETTRGWTRHFDRVWNAEQIIIDSINEYLGNNQEN